MLTPAGRALYAFVAPFYEQLPNVIRGLEGGELSGTLRIHASAHVLRHLLPEWLRRLQQRRPEILDRARRGEDGRSHPAPLGGDRPARRPPPRGARGHRGAPARDRAPVPRPPGEPPRGEPEAPAPRRPRRRDLRRLQHRPPAPRAAARVPRAPRGDPEEDAPRRLARRRSSASSPRASATRSCPRCSSAARRSRASSRSGSSARRSPSPSMPRGARARSRTRSSRPRSPSCPRGRCARPGEPSAGLVTFASSLAEEAPHACSSRSPPDPERRARRARGEGEGRGARLGADGAPRAEAAPRRLPEGIRRGRRGERARRLPREGHRPGQPARRRGVARAAR